jgi:hypothetical protein
MLAHLPPTKQAMLLADQMLLLQPISAQQLLAILIHMHLLGQPHHHLLLEQIAAEHLQKRHVLTMFTLVQQPDIHILERRLI